MSHGNGNAYIPSNGTGNIKVYLTRDNSKYLVKFTRASSKEIYVDLKLTFSSEISENEKIAIKTNIKNSIINYINNLGVGNDVLYSGLISTIYSNHPDNYSDFVFDVDSLYIGTSANPNTSSKIVVGISEYSNIVETNITIS